MKRSIPSGQTMPERMEKHANKSWFTLSFNHKTTLTMGLLIPLAIKEMYPGELVKLQNEVKMMFAQLYLPIMHQCYFTVDWFFVKTGILWKNADPDNWETFIKSDPLATFSQWPYFLYKRAHAIATDGILNYMGFNAPPGAGTLIASTPVSVLPPLAYAKIWDEYFRNDQIQPPLFGIAPSNSATGGDNSVMVENMLPSLRSKRRNWPRDYYTSATPLPQQGASVLIPSVHDNLNLYGGPHSYVAQNLYNLDGTAPGGVHNVVTSATSPTHLQANGRDIILRLSSTIEDFRYAVKFTEYLERSLRAGDRYVDFVKRNFGYNPNPLYIDRPVWIGGYTGDIVISEVLATAEAGDYSVGQYTGQALARDNTPEFTYTCPDYGFVVCVMSVYPKASYYSGIENMWRRSTKMDYMWEQFALIGDQPLKNKEVWFSWYDADIAWNDQIFGYLPQYTQHKYSNDIVSGQMRTLWEGFHLGRKFTAASQVVLNSAFITCSPDIGRVFNVDFDGGEHECLVHAFNKIEVLRRLPKNALPQL